MIDGPKKDIPDSGTMPTSITVLIEEEEDLTVIDDPPEMRGLWDGDYLDKEGGKTTHVVIEESAGTGTSPSPGNGTD